MFNIQPRLSSLKSKRQKTRHLSCILQKCSLVHIETDLVVLDNLICVVIPISTSSAWIPNLCCSAPKILLFIGC
ncbi:unnamed protein product, partial [Musa banksii]